VKDYQRGQCKGVHDDEDELKFVKLGNDMSKVVQKFCYYKLANKKVRHVSYVSILWETFVIVAESTIVQTLSKKWDVLLIWTLGEEESWILFKKKQADLSQCKQQKWEWSGSVA